MADTIPYLVDENDPELESGMVEYGSCTGYLSRPKGGASLGSVVVIHENVGLVDHIKDVARHFAKEGFAALAPDMLQRHRRHRAVPDLARRHRRHPEPGSRTVAWKT